MSKIENGKRVKLFYALYDTSPEGELLERTDENEAFEFVFGEEELLPKFENGIRGLAAGDKFSFGIDCADAYGEEEEDAIAELPKEIFMDEGEIDEEALEPGEFVEMEDEDGNEVIGLVVENKLNTVIIDFNHPLAGLDLWFDGKILEVE
jgi:FKBP-type peptidyl-prolyl cis-trans isomerase SlyD